MFLSTSKIIKVSFFVHRKHWVQLLNKGLCSEIESVQTLIQRDTLFGRRPIINGFIYCTHVAVDIRCQTINR